MFQLLIVILSLIAVSGIHGYRGPFRRLYPTGDVTPLQPEDDPGEALFLTPLIEQGKFEEAKTLRYIPANFSSFDPLDI